MSKFPLGFVYTSDVMYKHIIKPVKNFYNILSNKI